MPRKPQKKYIDITILSDWDLDNFHGTCGEVVNKIQEMKQQCEGRGFSCIRIEVEREWDNVDVSVIGKRLETDKEFELRVKREKAVRDRRKSARQLKEEKERALYKQLAAKYG